MSRASPLVLWTVENTDCLHVADALLSDVIDFGFANFTELQ